MKTYHSRFLDDVNINNQMKNGKWRDYIDLDETKITTREPGETIGTVL